MQTVPLNIEETATEQQNICHHANNDSLQIIFKNIYESDKKESGWMTGDARLQTAENNGRTLNYLCLFQR